MWTCASTISMACSYQCLYAGGGVSLGPGYGLDHIRFRAASALVKWRSAVPPWGTMGNPDTFGRPLTTGVAAPDFTLRLIDTDRWVSLADYRGKHPLLLGLYRGLYCPFCRRAVATLGLAGDRLRPLGIETLAVIGTTLDNARLYYRHRRTRLAIAVDPALVTHRAYGLPKVEAPWEVVSAMRVNPSGELPEAVPFWEGTKALGRLDGFKPTEIDRDEGKRTWNQSVGEFLIDRDGIVRWLRAESTSAADYCANFPPEDTLVSASHALTPHRPGDG
jgi:peroxiredoxin